MNKKIIIEKTLEYVKNKMYGESSGHDWYHVYRVHKTAKYIAEKENADMFVVELAALLHDIGDWKLNEKGEDMGEELASEWLSSLSVPDEEINKVTTIISTMSFKGGAVDSTQSTMEGKVVQDADRLDAIGAIGIARTFAYGGHKGREIYDPEIKACHFENFDQYKNNKGTSINHFYEKLLLLKDLINTETGRKIAEKRHKFMEDYLAEFFNEWNGI
ncbi:HD domain-containing protein [Clostridium oryzae]|uniref:Putative hydrolase n=1 Tax=Clostridium oryzae TaxID=1450648 RepID=A0A1V4ITG1_9CLOT|nr:HD domain-containing protein [Clostridium oryzae]OPJ62757.1 putative hydrolase [Clostridium oryzae]